MISKVILHQKWFLFVSEELHSKFKEGKVTCGVYPRTCTEQGFTARISPSSGHCMPFVLIVHDTGFLDQRCQRQCYFDPTFIDIWSYMVLCSRPFLLCIFSSQFSIEVSIRVVLTAFIKSVWHTTEVI